MPAPLAYDQVAPPINYTLAKLVKLNIEKKWHEYNATRKLLVSIKNKTYTKVEYYCSGWILITGESPPSTSSSPSSTSMPSAGTPGETT